MLLSALASRRLPSKVVRGQKASRLMEEKSFVKVVANGLLYECHLNGRSCREGTKTIEVKVIAE